MDWQQSSETKQYDDEVEKYCVTDFENLEKYFDEVDQFNILSFWENRVIQREYPRLCRLARGVLSIPASSASSERAFSYCGNTLSKKRMRLSASTVESLAVVHSALKNQL